MLESRARSRSQPHVVGYGASNGASTSTTENSSGWRGAWWKDCRKRRGREEGEAKENPTSSSRHQRIEMLGVLLTTTLAPFRKRFEWVRLAATRRDKRCSLECPNGFCFPSLPWSTSASFHSFTLDRLPQSATPKEHLHYLLPRTPFALRNPPLLHLRPASSSFPSHFPIDS